MSYGGSDKVIFFLPADVNLKTATLSSAKVKIGGTELAVAHDIYARWGNEVNEEDLIGTDIPDTWTGRFRGQIIIEHLYCTDLDLTALVDPGSDGQVPETTITGEMTDTRTVPKTDTWTFKARLNQPEIVERKGGFVTARVTGVLTARPTRVQS